MNDFPWITFYHFLFNKQLVDFYGMLVLNFYRAWLACSKQSKIVNFINANNLSERKSAISSSKCDLVIY